jgi:hypothetical protein
MLLGERKVLVVISSNRYEDDFSSWDVLDRSLNPEEIYAKRQELEGLSSAVEQPPSSFRSVIDKVYEGECPVQEDAHTVGISVPASKSRLVRARLMLLRVALRNNACQFRIGLLSNYRDSPSSKDILCSGSNFFVWIWSSNQWKHLFLIT